jgi:hypothetical protein
MINERHMAAILEALRREQAIESRKHRGRAAPLTARSFMLEVCIQGFEELHSRIAEGGARGASRAEILRNYIDSCDMVLGVLGVDEFCMIKGRASPWLEKNEREKKRGAVPSSSREEAAAMMRDFGDIGKMN